MIFLLHRSVLLISPYKRLLQSLIGLVTFPDEVRKNGQEKPIRVNDFDHPTVSPAHPGTGGLSRRTKLLNNKAPLGFCQQMRQGHWTLSSRDLSLVTHLENPADKPSPRRKQANNPQDPQKSHCQYFRVQHRRTPSEDERLCSKGSQLLWSNKPSQELTSVYLFDKRHTNTNVKVC